MRLVLWANGNRGVRCLEHLVETGFAPSLVVVHPSQGKSWYRSVARTAAQMEIPTIAPTEPNSGETVAHLKKEAADLFVLAGYGPILRRCVLAVPKRLSINLHAGKLPEYRGSSPMNWALINGESSFTLSIIKVDEGVDTGDILCARTFPVSENDTIADVHQIANEEFPAMLSEVLDQILHDRLTPRPQNSALARYFPLRFPEDGLILWDQLTAEQIHNRIRALRPPYPGAFTYYRGRKALLIASRLGEMEYRGEPGRIYRITPKGLLIGAQDRCLWITDALFPDNEAPLAGGVERYESLATVRGATLNFYRESALLC